MLHENSVLSYQEQTERGRVKHYRETIYSILMKAQKPLTDREIMDILNEKDVNNVRPEITRLKQAGLIKEVDKTVCTFTGKKVRQTVVVIF